MPGGRFRGSVCVVAAVVVAFLAFATTASAWFASNSYWNTPLATNAPLDSHSSTWVTKLVNKVSAYGQWINTTSYSVPVYTVSGSQLKQRVVIETPAASYASEFTSVPIPLMFRPADGTDRQAAIWQPATDTIWEFLDMHLEVDGWHAWSAGRITGVSSSYGLFGQYPSYSPYGASATELSLLGGLIRPDELQAGHIDHVVALAVPHPLKGAWLWPARRSDGDSTDSNDIPEGARLRLPASLNVDSLGLTRVGAIIAHAVQRYGMVIRDKADVVTFYAQDPVNLGSNPYPALFDGKSPDQVLAGFPWSKLQVVQANPTTSTSGSSTGGGGLLGLPIPLLHATCTSRAGHVRGRRLVTRRLRRHATRSACAHKARVQH
jgi:hypothetical protein